MDLPVVMLERLSDDIVEIHKSQETKMFELSHASQSKLLPSKKLVPKRHCCSERDLVNPVYWENASQKQSRHNIMANSFSDHLCEQRMNEILNKSEEQYPKEKRSSFVVRPDWLYNSKLQTTSYASSELENNYFLDNQAKIIVDKIRNEQSLKQDDKGSSKNLIPLDKENNDDEQSRIKCEDIDNYDWEIISEASCSTVSQNSSPCHRNHDAEYPDHTQLDDDDDISKLKAKLDLPNEKLSEVDDSDDDRLTEPYRSECEEEVSNNEETIKKSCEPYGDLKVIASHKNDFTSVTDEGDKEMLTKSKPKLISLTESSVKGEQNRINISVSHLTHVTSTAISKNLSKKKSHKNRSVLSKHIGSIQLNVPDCLFLNRSENIQKRESSNNIDSEFLKNKSQRIVLSLTDSYHHGDEVKSIKSSSLHDHTKIYYAKNEERGQTTQHEKSELINTRNLSCTLNTENEKDTKNRQNVTSEDSKLNRYDDDSLLMQTMEKSTCYSVITKSDENFQKTAINEKLTTQFNLNGGSKVQNNKETSVLSDGQEVPEVSYLSENLCTNPKGTVENKMKYVSYVSKQAEQIQSKSHPFLNDHIEIGLNEKKICRKIEINNNMNSDSKVLSSGNVMEEQRSFLDKLRKCWKDRKSFVESYSFNNELCKSSSVDDSKSVQKLTNVNPSLITDESKCNKSFKIYHCRKKGDLLVKESENHPQWNKNLENSSGIHNKSILPTCNKNKDQDNNQTENVSSFELISLPSSKQLVEKTSTDKNTVVRSNTQLRKMKRVHSVSNDKKGIYETKPNVTTLIRQNSNENLICKTLKKKTRTSFSRRKNKVHIKDEGSDLFDGRNQSGDTNKFVYGCYSEDNVASRSKFTDIFNTCSQLSLNQSGMNQTENYMDNTQKTWNKSNLNKKDNYDVQIVNKDLVYSETGEMLDQFQSNLYQLSKEESNQTEDMNIKDNYPHFKISEQLKTISMPKMKVSSSEPVDINFQKFLLCDSRIANFGSQRESIIKQQSQFLEVQESAFISSPSVTESSCEKSNFQNILSIKNNIEPENFLLSESKNHIYEASYSENNLPMLKIESVYSLKDMQTENKSNDISTIEIKLLSMFDIYNELDAYTIATILDIDWTQDESLAVLTSLLRREHKELQNIFQPLQKSEVTLELQDENLQYIDNIRTLQLAYALFKHCQKLSKELSPEILEVKPEEISRLLAECGNSTGIKLSVADKKDVGKDNYGCIKLRANDKHEQESRTNDKQEYNQGISDVIGRTKINCKLMVNTNNTGEAINVSLDQQSQQLDSTTNTTAVTIDASEREKSDVIYLDTAQFPTSSVQMEYLHDLKNNLQNDSSNSVQQSGLNKSKSYSQITGISLNAVPSNLSVIKSRGLENSAVISNLNATSSNSLPFYIIPGYTINYPRQGADSYQKSNGSHVKYENYLLPVQKEGKNIPEEVFGSSQLSKLPSKTNCIQNQLSRPNQKVSTSATNKVLINMRNQAQENYSPIQSNVLLVTNQCFPQGMPVSTNLMFPVINQSRTSVSGQHAINTGLPVQAVQNLLPVSPMYGHPTGETWYPA